MPHYRYKQRDKQTNNKKNYVAKIKRATKHKQTNQNESKGKEKTILK